MNFPNAHQRLNALPIIPAPAPGSDSGSDPAKGPGSTPESTSENSYEGGAVPRLHPEGGQSESKTEIRASAKSSACSPQTSIAGTAAAGASTGLKGQSVVTPDEVRVLRAVRDYPGQKAGAYAKLARMGAQKCSKLRRQLVGRGLLAEEAVQLSTNGRNALIVTLTAPGRLALETCK